MTTEPRTKSARAESSVPFWDSLAPWDRVALWEEKAPGTAAEMLKLIAEERRRRYRLAWAEFGKQLLGVLLGFGSVLVMAMVAWHYADLGQAVAGATFAGTGMVATVAIFVTGKYLGRGK